MAALDSGNSTANPPIANVNSNFQFEIHTPSVQVQAGFMQVSSETDSGSVTASRAVRATKVSGAYRLRIGNDCPVFYDQFPGANLNSSLWSAPVTTMTLTTSTGFAFLNAGASSASGAVAQLLSYKAFPMFSAGSLVGSFIVKFGLSPQANNTCEWGFGFASGTSTPTDGVFFRTTTSDFVGVVNFNGTETTTSALGFSALVGTNSVKFSIIIAEDRAEFWVGDVLAGSLALPATQSATVSNNIQPLFFRNNNTGATTGAQSMNVGAVAVFLDDAIDGRTWANLQADLGGMAGQGQTGSTLGTTAKYPNSSTPSGAIPTNTTAALGSGLGGEFWETDTLAVTTDGIISSYQVPVGTSTLPGKSLYITEVIIDSYVQTALTGGGYNAQWSLAFGHTAVSLATTEASTTKAPRRIALGSNTVASGLVIGSQLARIKADFSAPICIQPGEFIQLVKKKVGTAPTSTSTIAHVISFNGFWE